MISKNRGEEKQGVGGTGGGKKREDDDARRTNRQLAVAVDLGLPPREPSAGGGGASGGAVTPPVAAADTRVETREEKIHDNTRASDGTQEKWRGRKAEGYGQNHPQPAAAELDTPPPNDVLAPGASTQRVPATTLR